MDSVWENWVIDAGLSHPEDNLFCFVPIEGNIKGKCSFVVGMNFIGDESPGKLVAIIHPDGQEAADKWYEKYKDKLPNGS